MKYRVKELTMAYVEREDRLMLQVADIGGARLRIWLSRRLCRLWLKEIVRLMHRLDAAALRDAIKAAAILSFEHAAANEDHAARQGRLVIDDRNPSVLATAMVISASRREFLTRIETTEGHLAFIKTPRADLHQLIGSLHRLSVKADWALEDVLDWVVRAPEMGLEDGAARAN